MNATCKTCRWQPEQLPMTEKTREFIRFYEQLYEAQRKREAELNEAIIWGIHHESKESERMTP